MRTERRGGARRTVRPGVDQRGVGHGANGVEGRKARDGCGGGNARQPTLLARMHTGFTCTCTAIHGTL